MDLAKGEDPYVTALYIISNDLCVVADGKHGSWSDCSSACLKGLYTGNTVEYSAITINVRPFNTTRPNKNRRCYAKSNQTKTEVEVDRSKHTFKYGL